MSLVHPVSGAVLSGLVRGVLKADGSVLSGSSLGASELGVHDLSLDASDSLSADGVLGAGSDPVEGLSGGADLLSGLGESDGSADGSAEVVLAGNASVTGQGSGEVSGSNNTNLSEDLGDPSGLVVLHVGRTSLEGSEGVFGDGFGGCDGVLDSESSSGEEGLASEGEGSGSSGLSRLSLYSEASADSSSEASEASADSGVSLVYLVATALHVHGLHDKLEESSLGEASSASGSHLYHVSSESEESDSSGASEDFESKKLFATLSLLSKESSGLSDLVVVSLEFPASVTVDGDLSPASVGASELSELGSEALASDLVLTLEAIDHSGAVGLEVSDLLEEVGSVDLAVYSVGPTDPDSLDGLSPSEALVGLVDLSVLEAPSGLTRGSSDAHGSESSHLVGGALSGVFLGLSLDNQGFSALDHDLLGRRHGESGNGTLLDNHGVGLLGDLGVVSVGGVLHDSLGGVVLMVVVVMVVMVVHNSLGRRGFDSLVALDGRLLDDFLDDGLHRLGVNLTGVHINLVGDSGLGAESHGLVSGLGVNVDLLDLGVNRADVGFNRDRLTHGRGSLDSGDCLGAYVDRSISGDFGLSKLESLSLTGLGHLEDTFHDTHVGVGSKTGSEQNAQQNEC